MPHSPPRLAELSRRERQIMDVLFRRGRASAAEVRQDMPAAPSYSAVRAMLRILEDKGFLKHEQDGPRYVYVPTIGRETARRTALKHVVNTFFEGSTEQVMAALLDMSAPTMSDDDLARLRHLIDGARKDGEP